MKLLLGPANLQTEFELNVFKKVGPYSLTGGRLGFVNSIGVLLSGGLDSLALLCVILTDLRDNNKLDSTSVICFTVAKSDGPTYYVPRLIKKVEEHFNVKLTHVTDIPNCIESDKTGDMGQLPIMIARKYNPNMILYTGVNRMAPDDVRPFKQRLQKDYGHSTTGPLLAPFLFLHKPQILDILFQLGCEDLLQYTHTCTVLDIGACGECYSCAERQWGFDALSKVDPGTLYPDN